MLDAIRLLLYMGEALMHVADDCARARNQSQTNNLTQTPKFGWKAAA
jgi:hypothetical protein